MSTKKGFPKNFVGMKELRERCDRLGLKIYGFQGMSKIYPPTFDECVFVINKDDDVVKTKIHQSLEDFMASVEDPKFKLKGATLK